MNQSVLNFTLDDDLQEYHVEVKMFVERYIHPIIYALGIPGNLLSFFLWIQPRLRNSSGCYFACIAITDTIVLLLHMVLTIQLLTDLQLLFNKILCEAFNFLFVSFEIISVLLVLGLTVDRYVVVHFPMRRHKLCTIRRTTKVIAGLVFISVILGICEGSFWTYDKVTHKCVVRPSLRGTGNHIMEIGNILILVLAILLPSILVLTFNVLIVHELQRMMNTRR